MTGGIRCGLEEPLQPNEQILATDPSGAPRLATFSVPGLNRYSFVWARAEPIPFDFLEVLLGYDRGQRGLVVGWHHDLMGAYRVRSFGIERALAAAGWETQGEQGLGLGCKTLRKLENGVFPSVSTPTLGWFVMVGGALSLAELREDPFVATIRSFCRTSKLEPSRKFLAGLVPESVSIAYPMQGPSDVHGIVLVSSSPLSKHIESLQASRVISAVWRGESAVSVWLREAGE